MLVTIAYSRSEETFFVYRNDGSEVEVTFKNGWIYKEKPELTKEERQWFFDGNHKYLRKNF